jgi:hypothetical protein
MSEIIICGSTYTLTNEPKHGVVRKVKAERQESLKTFLSLYEGEITKDMDIDDAISKMVKNHPEETIEFGEKQIDFDRRSTISLACNYYFTDESFDEFTESEIDDIYDKCIEALGGDSGDFFERLESKSNRNTKGKRQEKKK